MATSVMEGIEMAAEAAVKYEPLVAACARRYEGRGAEYDDLAQEGRLAVLRIARRVNAAELARALIRGVPSAVRDAAERMTRRGRPGRASRAATVSLSSSQDADGEGVELEELIEDPSCEDSRASAELRATLELCFTDKERATASALMRGMTIEEIAADGGQSKSAVAMRIRRMRKKLMVDI